VDTACRDKAAICRAQLWCRNAFVGDAHSKLRNEHLAPHRLPAPTRLCARNGTVSNSALLPLRVSPNSVRCDMPCQRKAWSTARKSRIPRFLLKEYEQ